MIVIISKLNSKTQTDLAPDSDCRSQSVNIYRRARGFFRKFWEFSRFYGEYIAKSSQPRTVSPDPATHSQSSLE